MQDALIFHERDFVSDINTKFARFKKQEIKFDDCLVVFFFSQVRNILERDKVTSTYPYIDLYSNWMLHPQIDKNAVGKKIGEDIAKILKSESIGNHEKTKTLNESVGQWRLLEDIKTFSEKYNIDNPLLSDDWWKIAYSTVVRLLTWKPINLIRYVPAKISANEIDGINYDTYPVLWLAAAPGEQVLLRVALLKDDSQFSATLINQHQLHDILVFEAGLFHDAKQ